MTEQISRPAAEEQPDRKQGSVRRFGLWLGPAVLALLNLIDNLSKGLALFEGGPHAWLAFGFRWAVILIFGACFVLAWDGYTPAVGLRSWSRGPRFRVALLGQIITLVAAVMIGARLWGRADTLVVGGAILWLLAVTAAFSGAVACYQQAGDLRAAIHLTRFWLIGSALVLLFGGPLASVAVATGPQDVLLVAGSLTWVGVFTWTIWLTSIKPEHEPVRVAWRTRPRYRRGVIIAIGLLLLTVVVGTIAFITS